MFNKDAMDAVVEKVEAIVESVDAEKKVDEIEKKVEEVIENKAEEVEKKVEEIIAAAPPEVQKVIDVVESKLVEVINGREISCSCFGWLVSLRITRKSLSTPPAKSEATPSKELPEPAPSAPVKESPQTTVVPSSETDSAPPS